MDENRNGEDVALESHDFHDHHPRTGSMTHRVQNGDEAHDTTAGPDVHSKLVNDVLNSEIGVSTLLNRLKQSIASAKEFALFLKKRSLLEEEHSAGLRKLCRLAAENIRKPEQRHGSFLHSFDEFASIHDRIADNGAQFAAMLHQMHEELLELTTTAERGRKHWKTVGLTAEQRAADTDTAMKKSKAKYDSLAEDYDRARTGDRQAGKLFGLKGPKSAAQHEEDLLRKVQTADADYASKVQIAQTQRTELWSKSRPEAIRAVEDLIRECDAALTMQMQKFASYNEKLLLSNGLNISPIKGAVSGGQSRSLREVVHAIDNESDFNNYISNYANKVPPRAAEIKYERNIVLNSSQQQPGPVSQRQTDPQPPPITSRPGPTPPYTTSPPTIPYPGNQPINSIPASVTQRHERSFSQDPSTLHSMGQVTSRFGNTPGSQDGPPQLSTLPFQRSQTPPPRLPHHAPNHSISQAPGDAPDQHLPPLRPVFGQSLEQLFARDGSPVPMIVYQCIQAVDLFGLEVEGMYRLSGSATHIQNLKEIFDNGTIEVDFRNPETFFHDVNSVAGLLKQFFRALPDPLLTMEHHAAFVEAAKHDDDDLRRDSTHAIINNLPDPNYATLRALALHLNRVQEHASVNRMGASNLATVFGPTLMGPNTNADLGDLGAQVRVIETILRNTYQIFDED